MEKVQGYKYFTNALYVLYVECAVLMADEVIQWLLKQYDDCVLGSSEHTGKDSLKRMKNLLYHHMKNNNIFQKAKEDMLGGLINLKA